MEKLSLIALGGAIGAVLRWQSTTLIGRLTGEAWVGTLFVNVAGSVLMGVLAMLMMEAFPGSWGRFAPFAMTGLLGAFTTFSAFSFDTLYLIERGRAEIAVLYVGASVLLSIAGLWLGFRVARGLLA